MVKRLLPSPPRTPPASAMTDSMPVGDPLLSPPITSQSPAHEDQKVRSHLSSESPESRPNSMENVTPSAFRTGFTPAQWTMPTSGDLAFLASLPPPTVRLDEEASASSSSTSTRDSTTESADANATQSSTEPPMILSTASRQWIANMNGNVLHRRDTWAIGERWGRHVRVIDVTSGVQGGGIRKSSC